jgi:predicted DNA-binding transcriptional regulator YafY
VVVPVGAGRPCLQIIQQALWQDRPLRITVRWDFFNTEFEQGAEPYGLVAKTNIWHLVYGRGGTPHVVRVSQIASADLLPGTFTRPAGFDLASFWEGWCRDYESQPPFTTRVRVAPEALPNLAEYVGDRARGGLSPLSPPDAEGWVTLDLPFESLPRARPAWAGMRRRVLEPESLRKSLVDFAEQVVGFYKK